MVEQMGRDSFPTSVWIINNTSEQKGHPGFSKKRY
jgi:hypothetical protein